MLGLIGNLHPLLVHLPIGIFIFGVILKGYSLIKKTEIDRNIFKLVIISTLLFTTLSIISGLLMFSKGEYDSNGVLLHRNSGIFFAIIAILLYFLDATKISNFLWISGFLVLIFTGHLGGNLTHGEDFLKIESPKMTKEPIYNIQEAIVYEDLIKPILEEKCLSCHSSKKQKGDLRLDAKEFIIKGGENGNCIDPKQSLLLKRINLPLAEEEHMPPKGKIQLNENEKEILKWWITSGANFEKKVSQINQSESERKTLLSFQGEPKKETSALIISEDAVSEPSIQSLQILKKSGIVVVPIFSKSKYLSVTIYENKLTQQQIKALFELKDNLFVLNAMSCNDSILLQRISEFKNLKKLNLSNSEINDQGLASFSRLINLVSINLSGTKITNKGLNFLKDLPNLKTIYIFNSNINNKEFKLIKAQFPKTLIDTGGYHISVQDSLKFTN